MSDRNLDATLNLIRGLSAQVVMVGHGLSMAGILPAIRHPNFPTIQVMAVAVFLFLSGFVISKSIDEKPAGHTYAEFVIDRLLRFQITLLPCLFLVILPIDLYLKYTTDIEAIYRTTISPIHFIGNVMLIVHHPLLPFDSFGSARPLWTLSHEFWLYMIGGALLLLGRGDRRSIVLALLLVPVAVLHAEPNFLAARFVGLTWFFGMMSYFCCRNFLNSPRSSRYWLVVACVPVAVMLGADDIHAGFPRNYSLQGNMWLSAWILLIILVGCHFPKTVSARLAHYAKFLASFSFTLYCIHYSIFTIFYIDDSLTGWKLFIVGFLLSNILAIVVARFTEMRYPAIRRYIKMKVPFLQGGQAPR